MREVLFALGGGLVKILVSLFIGGGVGLLTFGAFAMGKPEIWTRREPPGEFFLGLGSGLLTTGGLMFALFMLPWLRRTARAEGRDYRVSEDLDATGFSAEPLRRANGGK
jgi:hypothetical protein